MPDLVSLNLTEDGLAGAGRRADPARDRDRGGRVDARDAELLARERHPGAARAGRAALGEPLRGRPVADEIDAVLVAAGVKAPQLHHGEGPATWAVLDAAEPKGHELRIGLEDVLTLPDMRRAPDNAALVVEAILRYTLSQRADAVVAVVQESRARPPSWPGGVRPARPRRAWRTRRCRGSSRRWRVGEHALRWIKPRVDMARASSTAVTTGHSSASAGCHESSRALPACSRFDLLELLAAREVSTSST